MKYEENVWYGWNGGECPVHPETVVEVQFEDRGTAKASWFKWDHVGVGDIIAFRVINEHIISRANQGPVREVTTVRKETVPGLYGKVEVWEDCAEGVMVVEVRTIRLDRTEVAELTAAINTLTDIRDAMPD